MNALLKHQILNAAADADRRKLPSLAAVLTDALSEIERLAPFEPVTLLVKEPVVARLHEVASERTDDLAEPIRAALGDAEILKQWRQHEKDDRPFETERMVVHFVQKLLSQHGR